MKRLFILLLAVSMLLLLAGCTDESRPDASSSADEAQPGYRMIDADEAAQMIETEEDYIILDVRTEEEFAEGHIPNAICIPNETISPDAPIPALPDKDQLILVYCRSGRRSKEAAQKLADMGYTHIVEFGGIIDWHGDVVTE